MDTTQALNVLSRNYRYSDDAVLIGRAYDYQAELVRSGKRLDYLDELGDPTGVDDVARAYVRTEQADRRYRLHVLASSGHSAIVRYRGARYRVEGRYDPFTKARTFYVYAA